MRDEKRRKYEEKIYGDFVKDIAPCSVDRGLV